MIDVIVAAILMFAFLAGILWMCDDLWRKTYLRRDLELSHWHAPHVHRYDSANGIIYDEDSTVVFCECGESIVLERA